MDLAKSFLQLLGLSSAVAPDVSVEYAAQEVAPVVLRRVVKSNNYNWLRHDAYNEHHSMPRARMLRQHAQAKADSDPTTAAGADAMLADYYADARALRNLRKARRRALRGAL